MPIPMVDARDDLVELFEKITGMTQGDYIIISDERGVGQHRLVVDSSNGFYELFYASSLYEDDLSRPALIIRPLQQKWRVVHQEGYDIDEEPIWPNRFDSSEQALEALDMHLARTGYNGGVWTTQAVLPEEGDDSMMKGM